MNKLPFDLQNVLTSYFFYLEILHGLLKMVTEEGNTEIYYYYFDFQSQHLYQLMEDNLMDEDLTKVKLMMEEM